MFDGQERAVNVAGEYRGLQAKLGVVGLAQGLLEVVTGDYRRHRRKGLLRQKRPEATGRRRSLGLRDLQHPLHRPRDVHGGRPRRPQRIARDLEAIGRVPAAVPRDRLQRHGVRHHDPEQRCPANRERSDRVAHVIDRATGQVPLLERKRALIEDVDRVAPPLDGGDRLPHQTVLASRTMRSTAFASVEANAYTP